MFLKTMIGLILMAMGVAACAGPPITPDNGVETPPATVSPDDPVVAPPYPDPDDPSLAPWEPQPGDEELERGEIIIESTEILILESFPPQFVLSVTGALPTPCHQLRVEVAPPDEGDRILVEMYSLVDPEEICIQVVEPFEVSIHLGSYATGKYAVILNGEQVGEIAP